MNLVFENLKEHRNFIDCPDVNLSTLRRFATSPIAHSIIYAIPFHERYKMNIYNYSFEFSENLKLDHYLIATGVNHHPNDWTGSHLAFNNQRKESFLYLNSTYLKDLQEGRAMLLFDQCLEGYQTTWLWQYFHEECEKYKISPRAIIYVTGNVIANEQYDAWANEKQIVEKINVVPYTVFEHDVTKIAKEINLISNYEKNYSYKVENQNQIKTFNCLQKRLRPHRIWLYKYLVDADLVNEGIISMNPFHPRQTFFEGRHIDETDTQKYNAGLPKLVNGKNNNEFSDNYYIRRITTDVFLDSWLSIVSEASAGESDETIFISEKIFKPIICFHPFIVVSNQGYLEKLKEMGYKTFDGFIDESYDKMPNVFDRYNLIIDNIKKISSIKDKLSWFNSLESILIHNYETLMKNSKVPNPALYKINNCYKNYFNLEI